MCCIHVLCRMTQNLRLSGGRTLTSADSNVASSWYFPSTANGDSYTDAYSNISSNTSYGGYYNYCAASAGTVCSDTVAQNAIYDICPKGWRLPDHTTVNTLAPDWMYSNTYTTAFSPVASGYRYGGLRDAGSSGYWWSSTADYSYSQWHLGYDVNSGLVANGLNKRYLLSIRCVRNS